MADVSTHPRLDGRGKLKQLATLLGIPPFQPTPGSMAGGNKSGSLKTGSMAGGNGKALSIIRGWLFLAWAQLWKKLDAKDQL